jgi:general secretion pathway protein F
MKRILIFWGIIFALAIFAAVGAGFGDVCIVALGFWIVLAFLHYRHIRQEEFLAFLTTAVRSQAPLDKSLLVYLKDRPRDRWHNFWVALIVSPIYYFSWHREHSFDRKIGEVVMLLRQGAPLYIALEKAPGVASRETILAAAVGESTGRLPECLESVPRWRLATVWLDALPRWIYPLFLLTGMAAISAFLMVFITPKFEKIFEDFHMRLPWLTEQLIIHSRRFWLLPVYLWLALLALVTVLLGSSICCWHCPIVRRFYRMDNQGRVLQMLGLLLHAGQTVPDALRLLTGLGAFRPVVHRRLTQALHRVEQGAPLPETLQQQGLLPRSMLPLVQAAQRAGNLPWALSELGESLNRRLVRQVQRFTMIAFPLLVMAVGLLVGLFVVGYFLPLIEMISRMDS